MDLNVIKNAELVSVVGSVATIHWPTLRTFTVDFDLGVVRYVESCEGVIAGHTEGRGEVKCEATKVGK